MLLVEKITLPMCIEKYNVHSEKVEWGMYLRILHLIFLLFNCTLLNSFVYVYYFHSQVIEIKEGRV